MHDPPTFEAGAPVAWLYVTPTREMLFWSRALAWLVAPGRRDSPLRRLARVALVTPTAHLCNLSVQFQSYLFDIFHQTRMAQVGHVVCMPVITLMMLAALAPVRLSVAGLALPLAAPAALAFAGLYVAQAALARAALWGAAMVALTASLYVLALRYASFHAGLPGRAHTLLSPWALMWLFALLQALSHMGEAALPPRVSASDRWLPVRDFLRGPATSPHARRVVAAHAGRMLVQTAFGTFDEWLAGPRLLPVVVLNLMWAAGYAPGMRAQYKALAARALREGQPAIDYIGAGGGTPLVLALALPADPRAHDGRR